MNTNDTISIEDKFFAAFYKRNPIVITHGKGVHVWDELGQKYIDLTAGWGVTSLGHSHPTITDAIVSQSQKVIQTPNCSVVYSRERANLLELISSLLPSSLNRFFFSNSGAESNDAALKFARKASGRSTVISAINSFHGRTLASLSATGQEKYRHPFTPRINDHIFVPFNNLDAIYDAMDANIAAVILEPIQGEGGIILPDQSYLKEVKSLCKKYAAYLILDEIQTGIGRTGKMFAFEHSDTTPDILTLAKGIANGFPFGAVVLSDEIYSKLSFGDHGGTYSNNPLGCAVAEAVLRFILEHDILDNVCNVSEYAMYRLNALYVKYPNFITHVRGKGLLIGVTFSDANILSDISVRCQKKGLLINITQSNVLRIFPALTITTEEMKSALDLLEETIEEVRVSN